MFYHFKGTITGEDYQKNSWSNDQADDACFFRNYAYFFGY